MNLPKDERQRREVIRRASRLAGLLENPSFQELVAETERKAEREHKSITARVMSPEGMSQREIDYWRGFIAGTRAIIAVPYGAEGVLKQVEREQRAREEALSVEA